MDMIFKSSVMDEWIVVYSKYSALRVLAIWQHVQFAGDTKSRITTNVHRMLGYFVDIVLLGSTNEG